MEKINLWQTNKSFAWHVEKGGRGISLAGCRLCYCWPDEDGVLVVWADNGGEEIMGRREFARRIVPEWEARKFPGMEQRFAGMPSLREFLIEKTGGSDAWW